MEGCINLNNGFYENSDVNFENAYKMCEKHFSHSELLSMLKQGNIPEKQIAALKFDYVKSREDAEALLLNLTGCDGKIREAVALKINQILILDSDSRIIFAKLSPKTLADASIDINANICRLAVDSARILCEYEIFASQYSAKILQYTQEALSELDKFIFRDKKYVINKQIFKLYWCLEALTYFYGFIDSSLLKEVIEKCSIQKEYTIREKTAQILAVSSKFPDIAKKLMQDENYYVRQIFLNHPSVF